MMKFDLILQERRGLVSGSIIVAILALLVSAERLQLALLTFIVNLVFKIMDVYNNQKDRR